MSAFSGASPDAGRYALPPLPDPPAPQAVAVDAAALAASGEQVTQLVAALVAGEASPLLGTSEDQREPGPVAAATSATAALAARLPTLSGVTGPAAVDGDDEDPADLLSAYASLLVHRSARRRPPPELAVTREALTEVARTAAGAARVLVAGAETAAGPVRLPVDDLVRRCSTGLPARTQLSAACVLLAQTAQDGGGAPTRLRQEIADLFA